LIRLGCTVLIGFFREEFVSVPGWIVAQRYGCIAIQEQFVQSLLEKEQGCGWES
jgi:hypothetical protein